MNQQPPSSVPAKTESQTYLNVVAWSWGGLAFLVFGLWSMERLTPRGIQHLRDFLGYGHFTLAYIFTWRMIRRQLGSLSASLGYAVLFLGMVACYAVAQRWLFSEGIDDLVVMVVFMIHHASNEVLFRAQTANGYKTFPWNPQRILWVALVVWLVLVDRIATLNHPWRIAGGALCGIWLIGWAVYGGRHLLRGSSLLALAGWGGVGGLVLWRFFQPAEHALFAWKVPFAWIVVYHYVIWYVFYTRKLLSRAGHWSLPQMRWGSLAAAWKTGTTVPLGFLALVAVGNLAIFGIYAGTLPAVSALATSTGLDFFHINTIAHILFGVGVPNRAAGMPAAPPLPKTGEQMPQFA